MSDDLRLIHWLSTELGLPNPRCGPFLSGGNVNMTRQVDTDNGPVVVRYPPKANISPRSGDGIRREAALLAALGSTGVAPQLLGFCDDVGVIGTPFMVMSFVQGASLTDCLPPGYAGRQDAVDELGRGLVDAIAAVHGVDWRLAKIKTGDPKAFVPRQIERWLALRADVAVRELPLLTKVGKWLQENAPEPAAPAIVHGDYHLDNTLSRLDQPGVAAIIDWELATIADPLMDLALLLMFWGPRRLEKPAFPHVQHVSRLQPVVSRRALAERWSRATGRSIDNLSFYGVFTFWRLAALVEGAYVLHVKGEATSDYARNLETDVPRLLEEADLTSKHGLC